MSRILKTGENQITQYFGNNGHSGMDIVKKTNQLDYIISHSRGVVTMVQTGQVNNQGASGNASYGNFVKIKHPNGYHTLYAHLASVSVKVGDNVTQGQTIGYMGNTGNSYGAHLHFELRNTNDVTINPLNYINADLPNLPTKEIEDMTKAETQAMIDTSLNSMKSQLNSIQESISKLSKVYKYATDVPDWYKEPVDYFVDKGYLQGVGKDSNGEIILNLTEQDCRSITMQYRQIKEEK